MFHIANHSDTNPEFARVIEVARLRGLEIFPFDISPDAAELAALARLLDAQDVRKLRFKGELSALAGGGWELEADLGATVVQTCVVSLEPVTTRVDQVVRRRFLSDAPAFGPDFGPASEDADEIEPLGERIDLGLVATEALALALPSYPRKPGVALEAAVFAAPGVQPLSDTDVKPFAALAALRTRRDESA